MKSVNYRSEKGREVFMRQMSNYLRALAKRRGTRRNSGVVSADDVHSYLTRAGIREQMVRTRLSLINSVFSNGDFEQQGSTYSSRPAAKGRSISTWSIA